jgi:DNA-binding GntR family transcriptional regulator
MRALERAQLVSTRLNQGFFVRELSSEEAVEVYDVRAVVYGFICGRLAGQISDKEIATLQSYIQQMDAAIVANDPTTYYQLNLQFHEESIHYAHHGCAQQTYQTLINETHLTRQRSLHTQERMLESNEEHKALIAALRAGDAQKARELGEAHGMAGRRRWEATLESESAASEQHSNLPPFAAEGTSRRRATKTKKA